MKKTLKIKPIRNTITKYVSFLFLIVTINNYNYSQDNQNTLSETNLENKNPKHYIGLAAATTLGRGFSYRFKPNNFGVQITGLPIIKNDDEYHINVGLKFLYSFFNADKFDVYNYLGTMMIAKRERFILAGFQIPPDPYIEYVKYHSSVGVGSNFNLGENFTASLNVGYGVYDIYHFSMENVLFNMSGGIGLYFKF